MKIGILTFHFARNYGAALQCYALQEALRSVGHEASVVDYRPRSVASGYRVLDPHRFWGRTPSRFLRKTMSEVRVLGARRARYASFEKFIRKQLNVRAKGAVDAYMCGSDQIWNARITRGLDPSYWGVAPGRHFSYAASFGDYVPGSDALALLRTNFETISVRENSALPLLEGLEARTDVDPVFLLSADRWSALADDSLPRIDAPYLLLYQVKPSKQARSAAERIASARALRLVVLSAKVEDEASLEVRDSSPTAFLRLFRDASAVVTTSFHGTAFSIIFHKDFLSFKAVAGSDSRQKDLLDAVGLTNCLVEGTACDLQQIDWPSVDERVAAMAAPSLQYLSQLK